MLTCIAGGAVAQPAPKVCHPEGAHAGNQKNPNRLRATEGSSLRRREAGCTAGIQPHDSASKVLRSAPESILIHKLRSGASLRMTVLVRGLAAPAEAGATPEQGMRGLHAKSLPAP